ncbi:hypothetical protein ABC974_22110 [Sphingomonas oligophenolica]|uniref:Uncharacterized protein n=1 Tax=Sphingomonas oligophenolica TaxID=301154 RepID=A0ABU9Y964_9SPHN
MPAALAQGETGMAFAPTRRDVLLGGGAGLAALSLGEAVVAQTGPGPSVMDRLDPQLYIEGMTLHAHYMPGQNCGSKLQFMTQGDKRYLFHSYMTGDRKVVGRCLDVTDPLHAVVVGDNLFAGYQMQIGYNHVIRRWILITSVTPVEPQIDMTRGFNVNAKGLRGIRIYDVTDPSKTLLLSEWSCDQGDPGRALQEGTGTHRNFYTGGRYAYLDTSPDNSFTGYELGRANGVQIIDILDPAHPKFVSNIWVPGQRRGEEAEYREFAWAGGGKASPSFHGGFIVPENVEDGGRLGYGAWSVLGVRVHDLSDVTKPRLVGTWNSPDPDGGGIKFHTVDVAHIDRGIVMVSPEMIGTECKGSWYNSYVLDARDPARLKMVAKLPVPKPPAGAPFADYCQKRGRFGPHNAPHQKAPGQAAPNFTCYTYFDAGLQCYDISNPADPRITGFFVPPQMGSLDRPGSYNRDTDGVFVEWDRRLIWASTSSGLYLLSSPTLGNPTFARAGVRQWTLPALRRHWPRA